MAADTPPWDHGFANKWPAARAVGPNVTREQALEFIFRTDDALVRPEHQCNDRHFCHALRKLIGEPEAVEGEWAEQWRQQEAFAAALGHIGLIHLSSSWVASSYIGGPGGLVSPVGEVRLAQNFGKWPNNEEIEADLAAVSSAFPWLAFSLWLWDSPDEDAAVRWAE